jgi:hypothetical protein
MLMSDSLGGNAKTLMFVNVAPSGSNLDESMNSLVYATRVRTIKNSASRDEANREVQRCGRGGDACAGWMVVDWWALGGGAVGTPDNVHTHALGKHTHYQHTHHLAHRLRKAVEYWKDQAGLVSADARAAADLVDIDNRRCDSPGPEATLLPSSSSAATTPQHHHHTSSSSAAAGGGGGTPGSSRPGTAALRGAAAAAAAAALQAAASDAAAAALASGAAAEGDRAAAATGDEQQEQQRDGLGSRGSSSGSEGGL